MLSCPRIVSLRLSHAAFAALALALPLCSNAAAQPADLLPERFALQRDGHTLLLPYDASHDLQHEHHQVRHLAVMIHGVRRDGTRYHGIMHDIWTQQDDPELAVLTPQFITSEEVERHNLGADYPYWTRGGWSIGHRSRSDAPHARSVRVSSYEMLDELLLAAARRFPNLQRITLAGHSAGGQFVNRFAASSRVESLLNGRGVAMRYIVANPSSYLYFCDHRLLCRESRRFGPLEDNDCAMLDQYRYGLGGNLNEYLLRTGLEQIPLQYASRSVTYLLGEQDNDPQANLLDRGCGALAQGDHRFERGHVYLEYLTYKFGDDIHTRHRIATVPGVGHNAARMFGAAEGLAALLEAW